MIGLLSCIFLEYWIIKALVLLAHNYPVIVAFTLLHSDVQPSENKMHAECHDNSI